jgi:eukaryotic-like serine/threonine-protein kinase
LSESSQASTSGTQSRPELELGGEATRLDRYVLLERIGQGRFATVWAAYDPQLDRRVAIKLFHEQIGDEPSAVAERQARQLAEAQALARLSHPNVVAVHDVQTFDLRGQGQDVAGVFIVMEFLAGESLRDWMDRRRGGEAAQDWREVVAVFLEAGRGLAAAHERGLVHRDFKPSNVMFGADGRVRVLDFGLARADDRERGGGRPRIVGTPAYMAPEQHLGHDVDARGDQFGFCAALYEALYQRRPFPGRDRMTLAKAKLDGKVNAPPRATSVPAWVHAIVLRGLAVEPGDRFPNMTALLDELGRDPSLVRRRWLLGVGSLLVAGLIAGSSYGLSRWGNGASEACESPELELDGVWDPAVRAKIQRSFAATDLEFADEAFERVAAGLDGYTQEWTRLHREVCEATMVAKTQPVEAMAAQMLCLQRQLRRVAGITVTLEQADAKMIARAGDSVLSLEPPSICRSQVADARRERANSARRSDLLEIEGEVARAGVLAQLGSYEEAVVVAEQAVEQALALDDPGSAGRASLAQIRPLWYLGRFDEAIAASERAVRWAALVGDHETVALAQIRSIRVYIGMDKYEVAEAVARLVGPLVENGRLGKDVEAWYDFYTGILYGRLGRWDQAIARLEHGLALREQLHGPDHPELAALHNTYGGTLLRQRTDLIGALTHFREAQRLWELNFGPQYPELAAVYNNLGLVYLELDRLDDARDYLERAHAGFALGLGPDNPQLIGPNGNLAQIARVEGRSRDALALMERARELAVAAFGPENPTVAQTDFDLAEVWIALGELEQADEILERALAVRRRTAPDDVGTIVAFEMTLARCRLERGDRRGLRVTLERALAEFDGSELDASPPKHSLYLRALLAQDQGQLAVARELGERYVAGLMALEHPEPEQVAHGQILVITLLVELGEAEAAAIRARDAIAGLHPDDCRWWALHHLLGRAEALRGDQAAARAAFERALALSSGDDGNPRRAALTTAELARL